MRINEPYKTTAYRINALCTPVRIALVADLHNCDPAETESALKSANPDIIMIAGDLYESPPRHHEFAYDRALSFLSFCTAVAPVFYVQGNHDLTMPCELREELVKLHICLLEDNAVSYRGLSIGGLRSVCYSKKKPNLDFVESFCKMPSPRILLCHHPEYYRKYLKKYDIDLILSGHDHGGQWEFFGRGVYVPGQGLFPPNTSGAIDGRLVVSRGVANNVRVPRINNPTELVIIEFGA